MLILYPAFVNLPNINTPLASRIADNSKFFPSFKDCLGALDGLGSTTSKKMPYANQSTDQEGGKGTLMASITSMGAITRS